MLKRNSSLLEPIVPREKKGTVLVQQLHFGGCVSVRDSFACQTIGLNRCVNEANTVLHKGLTSHCVYMYKCSEIFPVLWHFIA